MHNRFLLPMSTFDILGSIASALTTIPIPKHELNGCVQGAIGNAATCTAQGFFYNLNFIVPCYNAVLCIYYILIIRWNKRDEDLRKKEPFFHGFAICPFLFVSIIGASTGMIKEYGTLCFLQLTTNGGLLQQIVVWTILMLYMFLLMIIITCMIGIFTFVTQREVRMRSFDFTRRLQEEDQRPGRRFFRLPGARSAPSQRRSNLSSTVYDTKIQAFLYIAGFFITYIFAIIIFVSNAIFHVQDAHGIPFILTLLHGIFGPLQGLWNCIIFFRPRYNKIKSRHRNKSFLRLLYLTIVAKPDTVSRTNTRNRQRQRRSNGQRLVTRRTSPLYNETMIAETSAPPSMNLVQESFSLDDEEDPPEEVEENHQEAQVSSERWTFDSISSLLAQDMELGENRPRRRSAIDITAFQRMRFENIIEGVENFDVEGQHNDANSV